MSRSTAQFETLPDEVLINILSYLDPSSLAKTLCLNRNLHRVASTNLLWRDQVLCTFKFWDDEDYIERRKLAPSQQAWKDLFTVRQRKVRATKLGIKEMVELPTRRLREVGELHKLGYGIKDVLLELFHDAPEEYALAQKYWSHIVLGSINRSFALQRLDMIKFRSDRKHPTEEGLAALSMFVLGSDANGDIDDTFRRLDEIVVMVRAAHSDIDTKSPRQKAVTIAEFLLKEKLIGIRDGADYYSMENQFLGVALRSSHHNSLPLISCVIYCYVCRAFDLRAQPCNFPNHIHAVVQPPLAEGTNTPASDLDGQHLPTGYLQYITDTSPSEQLEKPADLTHLYIDPFHSSNPVPIATLNQQLSFLGGRISRERRTTCLLPASARDLLIRTSLNIITSIRHSHDEQRLRRGQQPLPASESTFTDGTPLHIDFHSAAYTALYTHVLFATSADDVHAYSQDLIAYFVHHFPEDIANYEEYIKPVALAVNTFGNDNDVDSIVDNILESDEAIPEPKLRRDHEAEPGASRENIKFKVGTVFTHRRQGYTAVIYGWDSRCKMDDRWIVGNRVDDLPKGRGQPFYNAYVDDKTSRYVAQENIVPLEPGQFSASDVEKSFGVSVGQWFRRFDEETAMFVSNIRHEYPED